MSEKGDDVKTTSPTVERIGEVEKKGSPTTEPIQGEGKRDIQMLMDVELTVTAELGRTRMTIGEIMKLSGGSIVRFSKAAGEMVDLRINDRLFASGEVVVVDEHFAVKITKLLSKQERARNFP